MRPRGRFGVIPASLFTMDLDIDAIVVATLLSTYADRNGWAFPGLTLIATRLKRTRPWALAAIKKLEDAKVLQVVRGQPGQKNRYRLLFDVWLSEEADPIRMPDEIGEGVKPAEQVLSPLNGGVKSDTPEVFSLLDPNTSTNTPKNTTKEHSHAAAHANGSRLASDWEAGEYEYAYARQFGYGDAEIARISENFRDYWIAQPGARGRKSDWHATWRTWVRREAERRGLRPADRRATATEERRARIAGGLALFEARTGKAGDL